MDEEGNVDREKPSAERRGKEQGARQEGGRERLGELVSRRSPHKHRFCIRHLLDTCGLGYSSEQDTKASALM